MPNNVVKITAVRRKMPEKTKAARVIQRARELKAERQGQPVKKVLPWK